jgi:hypothetical protein
LQLKYRLDIDSPGTEIVISSLLPRSDKPELSAKVKETNKLINAICCKSKWKFIDHKLVNATCLNSRGLHLNRKGTAHIQFPLQTNFKTRQGDANKSPQLERAYYNE